MVILAPPDPALDPLRPATHAAWYARQQADGGVRLSRLERFAVAWRVLAFRPVALPAETGPGREGEPGDEPPPFHALRGRLDPATGWRFEAPVPDEEAGLRWDLELEDEAWWDPTLEPDLELDAGGDPVVVFAGDSEAEIHGDRIEVHAEAHSDGIGFDQLVCACQEATGWAAYDDHAKRLVHQPIECPSCGAPFELPADGREPACPDCGADPLKTVRVGRAPAVASAEPGRLLQFLASLGWVELGPRAPDLDPPEIEEQDAAMLAAWLLASGSVEELYATDAELEWALSVW